MFFLLRPHVFGIDDLEVWGSHLGRYYKIQLHQMLVTLLYSSQNPPFCVFFAFLWETILITFSSCDTLTLLSRDVRLQSRRFVSHVPSCALTPKPRNTKSQVWSVWKCEENMSWFYVPNSFLKTSFVCEEATSHSKEWSTALFSFDVWKCDQIRFLVFNVLLLRF